MAVRGRTFRCVWFRGVWAAVLLGGVVAPVPHASAAEAGGADPCRALALGKTRYRPGPARHVVFAVADRYGDTEVTITECARTARSGRSWRTVLTTRGHVGRNGFAAPGAKREGDGMSPSGSFSLTEAFGEGNPGTALPYRRLRDGGDCWGSTVGDPRYNRYYRGTCLPDDENLSQYMKDGPYKQAVVIDYNRPPQSPIVQGHGSAIFLHISAGRPTAGCVSLERPQVEAVMRTLRPHDRIMMGPREVLFRP